ncbi:winged helix-turn-helix domain-containing protein [Streptosporangium sp. DT93]|uniref:winged helix-turn-helix domain-containing protein n=1 Tax=Streptosporangium sp. DT93 TaxID=3393428 RepID=UPI003CF336D8
MINWEPERPIWEQVAEIIQRRIEDGTYPPRTPIPSVERLQQEFEVGRNTARHVVKHLADEGFVRPVPSLGTFVLPRADEE